jgi:hypothetical protein
MESIMGFTRVVRFLSLLGFCIVGVTAPGSTAVGGQPHDGWWLCPGISLHRPCLCCPNDYCPKPIPCISPFCCCGPDDYCTKPLPCVRPFCCSQCDDYCAKPCPTISQCYTPPGSTCGSTDCCYSSCQQSCETKSDNEVQVTDR